MFDGKNLSKPESNVAIRFADELYNTLLNDSLGSLNNVWKVKQYLKTLWRKDDCSDHRIARDLRSCSPTAVVWKTGTNRADFELYGCQLHLDFMVRKINPYLCPYIFVVVVDANGSPRCALEGIPYTEELIHTCLQ